MLFDTNVGYDGTKINTYKFLGLNRGNIGYRGEFEDMRNMSADEYPCAAPRKSRTLVCSTGSTSKLIECAVAPDSAVTEDVTGVTGIVGGAFLYNGEDKSTSEGISLESDLEWEICRAANLYIINGYDSVTKTSKLYYYNIDTEKFSYVGAAMDDLMVTCGVDDEKGSYIEAWWHAYAEDPFIYTYGENNDNTSCADFESKYWNTIKSGKKNSDGTYVNIFEEVFKGATYSEADSTVMLERGDQINITGFPGKNNYGQIFSTYDGELVPQPTKNFSGNNTVDISDLIDLDAIGTDIICNAYVKSFEVIESSQTYQTNRHRMYVELYNKNNKEVTFDDMEGSGTINRFWCAGVTISRKVPAFTHIEIHDGRIWGTTPSGRYIKASSADNNYSFSDEDVNNAYAASLPSSSASKFTAMCEYGEYLLAFKEDSLSVVYGDNPESYSVSDINGIGCIDSRSVVVTPSGVYFLGWRGFYCYSGNTPKLMSTKLKCEYTSAIAGYDGNCYYAYAERKDGKHELVVYDMRYGLWHIQENEGIADDDALTVTNFFNFRGDFFLATSLAVYKCNCETGTDFEWEFTTCRTYDNSLDLRSVTEIWIRAHCEDGSYFMVYYTSDDKPFVHLERCGTPGMQVYRIPLRMIMGNNCRVKIEGSGKVLFYELELTRTTGGREYKAKTEDTIVEVTSKPSSNHFKY